MVKASSAHVKGFEEHVKEAFLHYLAYPEGKILHVDGIVDGVQEWSWWSL